MIVLDTNVLSELMCPAPNPMVVRWIEQQPVSQLYTTAITKAELLFGVAVLPESKRRQELMTVVEAIFEEDMHDRVLSFDEHASIACATIAARRRKLGRPISQMDAQIAAIAFRHQATLVTRNTSDFAECGLEVVNPWAPE